jgi:aldose 1-epimerase
MLHHSYFNLGGAGSGSVYTQELTIYADKYTPPAASGVPDGTMTDVAGTAFDFRTAHKIGDMATDPLVQSEPGFPGYDHNWVVNGTGLRNVAKYKDPVSGRVMTIQADQPGVQFYTTNYRPDPAATPAPTPTVGKSGVEYKIHEALALETQKHPNAINFPATVTPGAEDELVAPGKTYSHTMIHKFTAE